MFILGGQFDPCWHQLTIPTYRPASPWSLLAVGQRLPVRVAATMHPNSYLSRPSAGAKDLE
jgi:hypothetical protein